MSQYVFTNAHASCSSASHRWVHQKIDNEYVIHCAVCGIRQNLNRLDVDLGSPTTNQPDCRINEVFDKHD